MRKYACILLACLVASCQPVVKGPKRMLPDAIAPEVVPQFAEPTPLPGTSPTAPPSSSPEPPKVTEATILPAPTTTPAAAKVTLFAGPPPAALTPAGVDLILEYEVGGRSGYNPRPEAPDARLSGVTWGIGYDGHQNSANVILRDWQALGAENAQRLADTHPFVGRAAQAHLSQVRDILVAWQIAADVFGRIDVAREFDKARRAYPGFDALRPNCQAALISCGFNRGYGFAGANRSELRGIRDAVPFKDYAKMAALMRASERCWRGTEIYRGMLRRRIAEAKLIETP